MYISRINIANFRNFQHCEFDLSEHTVIVGENKVGKSNLIYALRLILDPRLSDAERHLRFEDFWDGLKRPLTKNDVISVSIDLTDFEDNKDLLAVLADNLVGANPMVARLTYLFRPLPILTDEPKTESDYEFLIYGGDKTENSFGHERRKQLPITVLPALRDAEDDLSNWRKSPLAPLLREIAAETDPDQLIEVAAKVSDATKDIAEIDGIRQLGTHIRERLEKMVGSSHAVDTSLNFSPADPNRLIRSLKLFIDEGVRGIADASLGCANLIYLSLLSLDLERQVAKGQRSHTFLAIEEPEAHLHPHLQRLAFRDFLRFPEVEGDPVPSFPQTILLTTHSPHIVSVAPLKSLVVLKNLGSDRGTVAASTARLEFEDTTLNDLERYLDVNRGECVFAKGIVLVEGTAEEYLVPAFGKLLGHDFDKLGITVCSVAGTNFEPYTKLFGFKGLNIPFVVLTDLDPRADGAASLGLNRVRSLLASMDATFDNTLDDEDMAIEGELQGVYLNTHTLEIDLFRSGQHEILCDALEDLTTNGNAKTRCGKWKADPGGLDTERFLKDIEAIGKGRYAQRVASKLRAGNCPAYIENSISHLIREINGV